MRSEPCLRNLYVTLRQAPMAAYYAKEEKPHNEKQFALANPATGNLSAELLNRRLLRAHTLQCSCDDAAAHPNNNSRRLLRASSVGTSSRKVCIIKLPHSRGAPHEVF